MLKSTARTIRILALLHVATGLVAAAFVEIQKSEPLAIAYLAILFADAGLLGLLAALGTQALPVRLIEVAVGFVYLCILASWVVGSEAGIFAGLLATSIVVVGVVLGILRHRGLNLRTRPAAGWSNRDEPLRFGIRHLMVWILASAVLLKIGQSLDPHQTLGILFSYGLAFAVVSVAAPWAALGGKRPLVRASILVFVSAVLGVAGPLYVLPDTNHKVDRARFFAAVTAFQAVILLTSLGLLRRTGLRLIRRETASPQPDIVSGEQPQC